MLFFALSNILNLALTIVSRSPFSSARHIGVSKAVKNVNEILGPALIKSGLCVTKQAEIDELLCKEDGVSTAINLGRVPTRLIAVRSRC